MAAQTATVILVKCEPVDNGYTNSDPETAVPGDDVHESMHVEYVKQLQQLQEADKKQHSLSTADANYDVVIDPGGGPPKYKCPQCTETFRKAFYVKRHINNVHDLSARTYRCPHCERTNTSLQAHEKHLNVHFAAKFSCDRCEKRFSQKANLARHRRNYCYKYEEKDKPYVCECGLSYVLPAFYERHRAQCTGRRQGGLVKISPGPIYITIDENSEAQKVMSAQKVTPKAGNTHSFLCHECGQSKTTTFNIKRHYADIHPAVVCPYGEIARKEGSSKPKPDPPQSKNLHRILPKPLHRILPKPQSIEIVDILPKPQGTEMVNILPQPQGIENIDSFKCLECGEANSTFVNVIRHYADEHPAVICPYGEIISKDSAPTETRKKVTTFQCHICGHTTNTSTYNIRRHYTLIHPGAECPYGTPIAKLQSTMLPKPDPKPVVLENAHTSPDVSEDEEEIDGFKCALCKKIYTVLDDLNEHFSDVHMKNSSTKIFVPKAMRWGAANTFNCMHCDRIFARKDRLQEHIKAEHGGCEDTGGGQTDSELIDDHVKNDIDIASTFIPKRMRWSAVNAFKCSICDRIFTKKDRLQEHMREEHECSEDTVDGQADSVDDKTENRHSANSVEEDRSEDSTTTSDNKITDDSFDYDSSGITSPVPAAVCNITESSVQPRGSSEVTVAKSSKAVGMRSRWLRRERCRYPWTSRYRSQITRAPFKKKIKCKECRRKFTSQIALAVHKLRHIEGAIHCPTCDCHFTNTKLEAVLHHIRTHRLFARDVDMACTSCPKTFQSQRGLVVHTLGHLSETGNPFGNKSKITGQEPEIVAASCTNTTGGDNCKIKYRCFVCYKIFFTQKEVAHHYRAEHSSNPGFVCTTCGLRFHSMGVLNGHQSLHRNRASQTSSASRQESGSVSSDDTREETADAILSPLQIQEMPEAPTIAATDSEINAVSGSAASEPEKLFAVSQSHGTSDPSRTSVLMSPGASKANSDSVPSTSALKYTCHCGRKFESLPALKMHETRQHVFDVTIWHTPEEFKASDSTAKWHRPEDLAAPNAGLPYACFLCSKRFATKLKFSRHYTMAHSDKDNNVNSFSCTTCGSPFVSQAAVNAHQRSHKANVITSGKKHALYKCSHCSMTSKSKMVMEAHRSKHQTTPRKRRRSLKEDDEVVTNVEDVPCDTCGRSGFTSWPSLTSHKAQHSRVYHSVCPLCGVCHKTEKSAEAHYRREHAKNALGVSIVDVRSIANFEADLANCETESEKSQSQSSQASGSLDENSKDSGTSSAKKTVLEAEPMDTFADAISSDLISETAMDIFERAVSNELILDNDDEIVEEDEGAMTIVVNGVKVKTEPKDPLVCEFCQLVFPNEEKIDVHKRKTHSLQYILKKRS